MYPDSFSVSKGEREGKISLGRQNLKTQSGFGCREREEGRRCDGVKWEEERGGSFCPA